MDSAAAVRRRSALAMARLHRSRRLMIGEHRCRISGGPQEPLRGAFEVPAGFVMDCEFGRHPRRIVLVEFRKAIGNQTAPFRSSRRRHCRVECFLIQHVNEGVALPGNGISGIAFPHERNQRLNGRQPRQALLCVGYAGIRLPSPQAGSRTPCPEATPPSSGACLPHRADRVCVR